MYLKNTSFYVQMYKILSMVVADDYQYLFGFFKIKTFSISFLQNSDCSSRLHVP